MLLFVFLCFFPNLRHQRVRNQKQGKNPTYAFTMNAKIANFCFVLKKTQMMLLACTLWSRSQSFELGIEEVKPQKKVKKPLKEKQKNQKKHGRRHVFLFSKCFVSLSQPCITHKRSYSIRNPQELNQERQSRWGLNPGEPNLLMPHFSYGGNREKN